MLWKSWTSGNPLPFRSSNTGSTHPFPHSLPQAPPTAHSIQLLIYPRLAVYASTYPVGRRSQPAVRVGVLMPDQQGQPSGVDKIRSLVEGYADACLCDLRDAADAPRQQVTVQGAGGWTVFLAVFPTPRAADTLALTECERHCLALLARKRFPVPAARLRTELERFGADTTFGIATVKRALARLKAAGLVGNRKRGLRGYFLLDDLPLLQYRDA